MKENRLNMILENVFLLLDVMLFLSVFSEMAEMRILLSRTIFL
jgi:hypothetical protein